MEADDKKLTEDEWKERLTPEQFTVLRKEGTEPAYSSKLHDKKESGVYLCAGCGQAVYSSAHKFDSGTGWPSFYQAIDENAVETKTDFKLVWPRTEVHCSRCGGHLGHIFDDGPRTLPDGRETTGKRHCINGVALDFKPIGRE